MQVIDLSGDNLAATKTFDTHDASEIKNPQYPMKISESEDHDNYLIFQIAKTTSSDTYESLKGSRSRYLKSPKSYSIQEYIRLYMPSIQENIDHEYNQNKSTIYADLINSLADGDVMKAGTQIANRMAQEVQNSRTMQQVNGETQRNQEVSLYKGTQMRSQTFKFELRPKNTTELKHIGRIIHLFRKYSSATEIATRGGTKDSIGTLKVPPVWFVEERIKDSNQLRYIQPFFLGPAVVTSVKVDKTPDQIYQSVSGTSGDPIHINLEVTMQETIPTYSQYWDTLKANTTRVV